LLNREDFKENLKIATMLIGLFIIIATPIALAVFQWHMNITWTVYIPPADETIEVYIDPACTAPWDHTLPLTDVSTPQTFDFYIKNEGNVIVDVTITGETITGGTAVWTPTSISSLAVGSFELMTLELTFTADGSYNFDFESNESP